MHELELKKSWPAWASVAVEGILRRGTVTAACEFAQVSKRTIYNWRDKDPDFDAMIQWAMTDGRKEYLENIAAKMVEEDGNHILLMFLLKKLDPRYREHYKVEHSVDADTIHAMKQALLEMGQPKEGGADGDG